MTIYAMSLALIAFLGVCLALYLQHLYEKHVQKRNERELGNEFLIAAAFQDWSEYRQRVAKFYDGDCNE